MKSMRKPNVPDCRDQRQVPTDTRVACLLLDCVSVLHVEGTYVDTEATDLYSMMRGDGGGLFCLDCEV